jgi:hypothetical protein
VAGLGVVGLELQGLLQALGGLVQLAPWPWETAPSRCQAPALWASACRVCRQSWSARRRSPAWRHFRARSRVSRRGAIGGRTGRGRRPAADAGQAV